MTGRAIWGNIQLSGSVLSLAYMSANIARHHCMDPAREVVWEIGSTVVLGSLGGVAGSTHSTVCESVGSAWVSGEALTILSGRVQLF